MRFDVQLHVREHHDGCYTVTVVGSPELCVYTPELDAAREELELLLSDLIERSRPERLERYAVPDTQRLEVLEVSDFLPVYDDDGLDLLPTRVEAIVARDRRWERVWFPAFDLHHWVARGRDIEEESAAFLTVFRARLDPGLRLQRRYEKGSWIEALSVEATPPELSDFLGPNWQLDVLPVPEPRDDDDEEEGSGERRGGGGQGKKRKGKKKRPPTPTLQRLGLPLSKMARHGELERAYGRDDELAALMGQLDAPEGVALVVIGAHGVGKTTALAELARRLRGEDAPVKLRGRPVWFADASRLVASDGWFGDWQRQCLDVIHECIAAEVVWCVGSLLALLDAGKSIGSDQNVSLLLRPYLAGRRLTIVGECTPREWSQLALRDPGFARLFTPFRLEEPPRHRVAEVIEAVAGELERVEGVRVGRAAREAVLELAERYLSSDSLLGSAVHFLRRLVSRQLVADAAPEGPLEREQVVDALCEETGLPPFLVRDDLALDPDAVLAGFRRRLIGQDEAVRAMSDLVAVMKAGLTDRRRPLGSFLFVGPTGVGKTEMARALAEFLFGRAERMVRFDMSEFVTPDSVQRFLGDAHHEGKLISEIRRAPFSVLLLDELEKAHPAVFDVLLQVLGEARLSDAAGRRADFRNTVVLMTSNLGVASFRERVGFTPQRAAAFRAHFLSEAERFFRPEFFNRLDAVIPFMPLEAEAIAQITDRELVKLTARAGLRQQGIDVTLEPEVAPWLAARGVEPRYGARPLKRVIERRLAAPMARALAASKRQGRRRVTVRADEATLAFDVAPLSGAGAGAEGALLDLLERVGALRYRVHRWMRIPAFIEAAREVQLVDRLARSRAFWRDRALAEARMRSVERPRELVASFEALSDQLAAVEELAFDLHLTLDVPSIDEIEPELTQAHQSLGGHELTLCALPFPRPDAAQLFFAFSAQAASWTRDLIEAYAALASRRGWTLRAHRVVYQRPDALDAVDAHAEDPEQATRRARRELKRDDEPTHWSWQRDLARLEPDDEAPNAIRRFTQSATLHHELPIAICVEGPHAATLLSAESGDHERVDQGASTSTRVLFMAPEQPERLPNPVDLRKRWDSTRRRRVLMNRRVVEDLRLNLHHQLTPRLDELYERFMRADLYARHFGQDGLLLYKHAGE